MLHLAPEYSPARRRQYVRGPASSTKEEPEEEAQFEAAGFAKDEPEEEADFDEDLPSDQENKC